jgi:PTS system nitrogen regulatory IIA component
MRRISMSDLITQALVIPMLHASSERRVLEKLSRFTATHFRLDENLVKRAVLLRGKLTTFGLGRGIAIPHATVPEIPQPFGAFARLRRPVDFGAADGRAADLVFVLLSPDGDERTLLRALSCVARRLRDRDVAENLRAVRSAEAAHIILTTDSWRGQKPEAGWRSAA